MLLGLCAAVGAVHCRADLSLDMSHSEAGTPGTSGSGGAGIASGGAAGAGRSGGGRGNGAGRSGQGGTGYAGAGAGTGGGAGTTTTAGAGDAPDHGGSGGEGGSEEGGRGESGSGGEAGAVASPCDCGSNATLTALDCKPDVYYNAWLSDDGSVVLYMRVDSSIYSSNYDAGLWTLEQGTIYRAHRLPQGLSADGKTALFATMQGLPVLRTLAGRDTVLSQLSLGDYLSRDGVTVVGRVETSSGEQIVTWTAAGGVVTPDFGIEQKGVYAMVYALNPDASVLAGSHATGFDDAGNPLDYLPFVWTAAGGAHIIATPPPPVPNADWYGAVTALSDDGSVAVGTLANGVVTNNPVPYLYDLFRWTEAQGITDLGPCRIADIHGGCDGPVWVSGDGSVAAFTNAIAEGAMIGKAFRWTNGEKTDIAPNDYALVRGMSADGNVIVGSLQDLDTAVTTTPFVWTTTDGNQDLAARIESAGADLSGWTLGETVSISRDGRVLVGNGTCHGMPALYRAYLPR